MASTTAAKKRKASAAVQSPLETYLREDLDGEAALEVTGGAFEVDTTWPTAGGGKLLTWTAQPGQRISIPFTVAEAGERRVEPGNGNTRPTSW